MSDKKKQLFCFNLLYFSKKYVKDLFLGRYVLTNFHGMDLTTDKLRSMVKKWQSLIEASADVKTSDGYLLRVFCIGFTQKDTQFSQRKTCYAQHTQVSLLFLKPNIKYPRCLYDETLSSL